MSRTDKDRPRHVINDDETMGLVEHHDHGTGVCDLADPDRPYTPLFGGDKFERVPAQRANGTAYIRRRCYRELDARHPWWAYTDKSAPDRLYRREFHAQDRARSRQELHRLIGEFNSHGDVDDSAVQPRDHRHSAMWHWW